MARAVGLVGGLGPESTIDYYRRILEAWERDAPSTSPSIVIDSLDVRRALDLVDRDRPALVEYLLASIERLAGAGVSFVAITANTAHIVFDELEARSRVPLLSIVETLAGEAQRRGLSRLALLGTRFTMEAPFYMEVCERSGIAVVSPREEDRRWVHERYVGELLRGEFRDETRREVIALIRRLRDEREIDGVILGGTELPLLLTTTEIDGVPLLDTTALHVAAIVERLRAAEVPPDVRIVGTAQSPRSVMAGPATVRRLTPSQAVDFVPALAELLIDCVEGGASVSFLHPLSADRAMRFWRMVSDGVTRGERAILVAEDDEGRLLGTVQLVLAMPENQPHRADVAKMLVHRRSRRRGVAQRLMRAVEEVARDEGRTLLVLDTVSGSDAERLYRTAGWTRVGEIPRYALMPDGSPCATTVFYKELDR